MAASENWQGTFQHSLLILFEAKNTQFSLTAYSV